MPVISPGELLESARRCYERREISLALQAFEAALAAGADPEEWAGERWMCYMLMGDFEAAWKECDRSALRPAIPKCGNSFRIRCEHGLGDAIQFLRYVPALAGMCQTVTVEACGALHELVHTIPGVHRVISGGECHCGPQVECSDLPYIFRTTIGTIPPPVPFQISLPQRARMAPLRVGVVWQAGSWNSCRSISLVEMEPLLRVAGVQFCSLQRIEGKNYDGMDLPKLPAGLLNLEPERPNILSTAKAVLTLDLLISVDTMVAHLAASLGIPVWLLLPFYADWRWMLERTDSPWYPSMRIFRQRHAGDWTIPIMAVRRALSNFQETKATSG